jgi:hypothetical protein
MMVWSRSSSPRLAVLGAEDGKLCHVGRSQRNATPTEPLVEHHLGLKRPRQAEPVESAPHSSQCQSRGGWWMSLAGDPTAVDPDPVAWPQVLGVAHLNCLEGVQESFR